MKRAEILRSMLEGRKVRYGGEEVTLAAFDFEDNTVKIKRAGDKAPRTIWVMIHQLQDGGKSDAEERYARPKR